MKQIDIALTNLAATLNSARQIAFILAGFSVTAIYLVILSGGGLNGYDSLGHFLRAEIIAKNCVGYKVVPQNGCSANFVKAEGSTTPAKTARNSTSLVMDRTLAVLKGMQQRRRGTMERTQPAVDAEELSDELGGKTVRKPKGDELGSSRPIVVPEVPTRMPDGAHTSKDAG